MENFAIGCDIEEVSRFEDKSEEFLNRVFTQKELDYSFKSKKYAQHLCARFCAKEAVIKALSEFNISNVAYKDIEVLNKENGAPYVNLQKYADIKIKISLSHCKNYAMSNVLIIYDKNFVL